MTSRSSRVDTLLAILVLVLALKSIVFPLVGPSAMALTPFVVVVTLVGFNVIHSGRRYGGKASLVFFALTCVISWAYETSSILTGFPFGNYHYADLLGPKLGLVPVLIMPAYFAMGYLSWTIAHILLDRFDDRLEKRHIFLVPVVASFVMVMWDLSIDPARATIEKAWIWHDGGAYFGVPIKNFAGWFLCVFTIFQCFALYLHKFGHGGVTSSPIPRNHWTLPTYLYAAMMIDGFMLAAVNENVQIESLDKHVWWTGDIHGSLALVSFFTMFFVSFMARLRISEHPMPGRS